MYHLTLCALLGAVGRVKRVYRDHGRSAKSFHAAAERLEEILNRGFNLPIPADPGPLEQHLLVRNGRAYDAADAIGYHDLPQIMRWKYFLEVLLTLLHKQEITHADLEGLTALFRQDSPTFKWGSELHPRWESWITPAAKERVERYLTNAHLHGHWVLEVEEIFFSLYHPVTGAMLFLRFGKAGLTWKGEGDDQVLDVRGE